MFPCMIARTTTTDVLSSGMGGTRNGALQLVIHFKIKKGPSLIFISLSFVPEISGMETGIKIIQQMFTLNNSFYFLVLKNRDQFLEKRSCNSNHFSGSFNL